MTGTVVSNMMTKALVVKVSVIKVHPKYHKRYSTSRKYHVACDDSALYEPGTTVTIQSCRPVSKTISFKVVQ